MKCAKCGATNRKGADFCTTCGATLKQKGRRQQAQVSRGSSKKIMAIVAGVVVIGVWVMAGGRDGPGSGDFAGAQSAGLSFSANVQRVAEKFYCGCGTCDEPELARCSCPTAVEERGLISQELKKGTSETEVVKLINRRYGQLKSRYASLIADGKDEGAPEALPNLQESEESPAGGKTSPQLEEVERTDSVATTSDTLSVTSRFTCACGQCGDLELADCSCDHPRGAREMKAFIDYKISQKQLTVDEIVNAVAYEYGHLKEE